MAREALGRQPAERPAFLAEGSAGDDELRRRAESLLSFYVRAEDSDAHPPGESPDGLLSTVRTETLVGRVLGQYRLDAHNIP